MLPLLLFFACVTDDPEGADTQDSTPRPTDDRLAGRLARGTDLCAYEDGEEVLVEEHTPDAGYVAGIAPEPYQPCLDGLVSVQARVLDHPEGRIEDHAVSATFFVVNSSGYTDMTGEWLDPLDGTDDCGLVGVGNEGLVADTDLAWLDAGTVTLEGAWGSTEMTRTPGGFVLNYETNLTELGAPAASGGSYGLTVGGSTGSTSGDVTWGAFDPVDLPDLVALPALMEVTSPPLGPGVVIDRADLPLEWTGTSDAEVAIYLEVQVEGADWPNYSLRCTVADDGAFTIPAALISAIPGPATGSLYVERLEEGWFGTEAGRSVHTIARARYEGWGLTLE